MADHHELVAEMPVLEQMGTQERQKLAKKRRLQQLKKWGQREKEWIAKERQLNKRLANMLHEENNGLNLKQYTAYGSNQRPKKRLTANASANATNGVTANNGKINNNNNNNNDHESLNNVERNGYLETSLTPHGRVHFNVGVMLLEAAARNDFDEVKRLLMLGVSPDSVNHDGLTALHQCCIDASEPIMNLLLEFGANVDARDTEQWTPLHAACTCGHLNLVEILVDHGADLLAVNGDGNMPFDICEDEATLDYIESQMVKRGITQEMIDFTRASTEMQMINDLETLLADGRDLNEANDDGVTPLHVAAANGYLSVVKFMLKHGADVNVCDKDLWRPLHGAACWGNEQHLKLIELLVEAGAQLTAKTINDETVFDLCDNVGLLEKLNQLKDELESKQATGTDRLKRTQSRTNSRIHSVRRTSVRDKNQISRREAREEAMLRVDNSPTKEGTAAATSATATTTTTTTLATVAANQKHESNDVSDKLTMSSFDQTDSPANNNNLSNQSNTSQSMENGDYLNDTSDVEVTRSHNSSTELEPIKLNSKTNDAAPINQVNQNLAQQTAQLERKELSHKSAINGLSNISNSNNVSNGDSANINTKSVSSDTQPISTQKAYSSKGVTTANRHPAHHQRSISETKEFRPNNNNNNNNLNGNGEHSYNSIGCETTCDPNVKQHQPQQQQIVRSAVQLAPINYTLSNLKKHRSDLRMRTTSIGGGSSIVSVAYNPSPNNISVLANGINLNANGHQVMLDPQPTNTLPAADVASLSLSSSTENGYSRQRPGAQSLTFRKFHGEPSEVIGHDKRKGRHKCCIIS